MPRMAATVDGHALHIARDLCSAGELLISPCTLAIVYAYACTYIPLSPGNLPLYLLITSTKTHTR
jgi:hypothetical protein